MASYNEIKKHSEGFHIKGIFIRDENNVYIFMQNIYDVENDNGDWKPETRIFYYRPKICKDWGAISFNYFSNLMAGKLDDGNKTVFFIDDRGEVKSQSLLDGKSFIRENSIDNTGIGGFTDLYTSGDRLFVCSTNRQVFCLDDKSYFKKVGPGVNEKEKRELISGETFIAIDGYSANEVYAGGAEGDFWLYNGENWEKIELPVNKKINSICCAPNGKVYLGFGGNLLVEGRKNKWKVLDVKTDYQEQTLILKLCWFKDALYILPSNSLEKLLRYKDGVMERVDLTSIDLQLDKQTYENNLFEVMDIKKGDEPILPGAPNDMRSNDEILVVSGSDSVITYDGNKWSILFNKNMNEEDIDKIGYKYVP